MAPTYWEKLVWSNGDGYGLLVNATKHAGRVGALICGESESKARYMNNIRTKFSIDIRVVAGADQTETYVL